MRRKERRAVVIAWPSTPLTSYAAGVTPYIKAFDLNSLQSGTNGIINGTFSLHSVVIDGTGGSVVAGTAGTIRVSATNSAAGASPAVAWGVMHKEAALFACCRISSAGAIEASYNTASIAARAANAPYVITFNGTPTNADRCTGQATGRFNAGARIMELSTLALVGANLVATVIVWDAAGAATDGTFDLHVFGG